ncbi:hypothetical protein PSA5_15735 [Pseudomonas syringae pv. actinidiae]|nr:hypothetical protein PSA5_15735 [Pseudomonas syringae pv. actinidiae]
MFGGRGTQFGHDRQRICVPLVQLAQPQVVACHAGQRLPALKSLTAGRQRELIQTFIDQCLQALAQRTRIGIAMLAPVEKLAQGISHC